MLVEVADTDENEGGFDDVCDESDSRWKMVRKGELMKVYGCRV